MTRRRRRNVPVLPSLNGPEAQFSSAAARGIAAYLGGSPAKGFGIMMVGAFGYVLAQLALWKELERASADKHELVCAWNRLPRSWVELVPFESHVDPDLYFYEFDAWRYGESDWWGICAS